MNKLSNKQTKELFSKGMSIYEVLNKLSFNLIDFYCLDFSNSMSITYTSKEGNFTTITIDKENNCIDFIKIQENI